MDLHFTQCRIGLWGGFDIEDYGQAMYAQVVRAELTRRLPGAEIRVFAPYGPDRPTRSDRGEPAESLGVWSPRRVAELAEQFDLVVVGGSHLVEPDSTRATRYGVGEAEIAARDPGRFFTGGLAGVDLAGKAMRWHVTDVEAEALLRGAGVDGVVDVSPHPVILASRLVPAAIVKKRLEYLRLMDWYPRDGGALVVQGGSELTSSVSGIATSLGRILLDRPELTPVAVELEPGDGAFAQALARCLEADGHTVHRPPSGLSQEDVIAAISGSEGLLGSSIVACLTATAYGIPQVTLAPGPPAGFDDAFARAVKTGGDRDGLSRLQSEVDATLDRIADQAAGAARSRPADRAGQRASNRSALESELRAVRLALRTRSERGNVERVLLADCVVRAEADLAAARLELDELRPRAEREAAQRAEYEAECLALRGTRTFRWTAAARSLYRRLGRGSR